MCYKYQPILDWFTGFDTHIKGTLSVFFTPVSQREVNGYFSFRNNPKNLKSYRMRNFFGLFLMRDFEAPQNTELGRL